MRVCVTGVIPQPPSQERGQRDRDGWDALFEHPMASSTVVQRWKEERLLAPRGGGWRTPAAPHLAFPTQVPR